jgi:hypothetical protein
MFVEESKPGAQQFRVKGPLVHPDCLFSEVRGVSKRSPINGDPRAELVKIPRNEMARLEKYHLMLSGRQLADGNDVGLGKYQRRFLSVFLR